MTGDEHGAPGLPKFDPNRMVCRVPVSFPSLRREHRLPWIELISVPQVHGSQFIEIIKPLPLVSGDGWKLKRRLVGVHENSAFFPSSPHQNLLGLFADSRRREWHHHGSRDIAYRRKRRGVYEDVCGYSFCTVVS